MRAVVDTNILVRGAINPTGTVGPLVDLLAAGAYTLIYSAELYAELEEVLERPRIRARLAPLQGEEAVILELVARRGVRVTPTRQITACRDPDDNRVLEAAVAGQADVIVSGDEDLLVLDPFEGIRIVGPADFIRMLSGTDSEPQE